ncbi:MAG: GNAT family N-acetyltransferase, partial [Alicyclobacillus sp.]|nr:GNAT family N-acetyltransferase [Alicyclobacillus sp.]
MVRIILRDGRVAELRPAEQTAADIEIIQALFREASPDSLYFRFFHAIREVPERTVREMIGDGGRTALSLLCLAGARALGLGSYAVTDEGCAEVSFLVADSHHGKGLGTLLLEHLADIAWRHGFRQFEANVLPQNRKMLQMFLDSGYEVQQTHESDIVHVVLPLTRTDRARALRDLREKHAAIASLAPFFHPATVAVVGASRDPDRLGHRLFQHILTGGFTGTVYPVNPSAHTVGSIRAYPAVSAVPDPVDLAVIVVPAEQTESVITDCIQAKVRAVMICSSGFAESGPDGQRLQQTVVEKLRSVGCRLIGPNSLGLINAAPSVHLNASFAPNIPDAAGIAIASHSGALGIAILDYARRIHLGVSSFVSLGNKADISSNDLLEYWEDDPDTQMILLYLESFGNPRKFSRIARRITRTKPIIAVKSGRTLRSQTTLPAPVHRPAPDAVVAGLFEQTGVIRVDTLQEMFEVAALLQASPLPKGRRVAVVTNTAGGGLMAVDALQEHGLTFVEPIVDLGYSALAEGYRQVLPQVLLDPSVDAIVILFAPVGLSEVGAVKRAIIDAIDAASAQPQYQPKPIVANFLMTEDYLIRAMEAGGQRIPIYPFPEQAVRALAKVVTYAEYVHRHPGRLPDPSDFHVETARALIRSAHASVPRVEWSGPACTPFLQAIGVRSPYMATGSILPDTASPAITINVWSAPLFGPVMEVHGPRHLGGVQ